MRDRKNKQCVERHRIEPSDDVGLVSTTCEKVKTGWTSDEFELKRVRTNQRCQKTEFCRDDGPCASRRENWIVMDSRWDWT